MKTPCTRSGRRLGQGAEHGLVGLGRTEDGAKSRSKTEARGFPVATPALDERQRRAELTAFLREQEGERSPIGVLEGSLPGRVEDVAVVEVRVGTPGRGECVPRIRPARKLFEALDPDNVENQPTLQTGLPGNVRRPIAQRPSRPPGLRGTIGAWLARAS